MSDEAAEGLAKLVFGLIVVSLAVSVAVIGAVVAGVAWVVWQCIRHIAAWVRSTPEWQEHELRQHATQANQRLSAVERQAVAGITERTQDALDRFQSEVHAAQREAAHVAQRR